jgi:ribosomal protein S12 methylthiotransferase
MIHRYLLENGHRITEQAQDADFIIINTCGTLDRNRDESIALYEKYLTAKKPDTKIILFGCLIKIDGERLRNLNASLVGFTDGKILDEFFSQTKKYDQMTPYCDKQTRNLLCNSAGHLDFSAHHNFIVSRLFLPFSKKMKSNYNRFIQGLDHSDKILVEVSKGCLGNCHYCPIKKAKGTLKSRPPEEILSDIRQMAGSSTNLFLVADDCSCYGLDIDTNIFELIHDIRDEFPGLSIQMNYISPNQLIKNEKLYTELVSTSQISYVTIPLQSGSQKILTAMNRFYDPKKAISIIEGIKNLSPETIIEGHFIVGYPGETILDFIKTLLISLYFDYPLSFPYSDTKGVISYTLPHKKSKATKYLRVFLMTAVANWIVFYRLLTITQRKETHAVPE